MDIRDLVHELKPHESFSPLVLRQAVVVTVNVGNSTVDVRIGGATTLLAGVKVLAGASMTNGDTVWLLQNGNDLLVIGRVGAPNTGAPGVSDHGALTGLTDDDHLQYQKTSEKNAANGYAGLDVNVRVPVARLGSGTPAAGAVLRGDGIWTTHDATGDPHSQYATDADLTAHAATSHGTAHPDLAAHDTLGLATQAELDTHAATAGHTHPNLAAHDTLGLATDAELTAHAAAADPHPTYETSAEAAAKITTHEAAADPHTIYQKESEKGAVNGYASLDAATKVPTVQLGGSGADSTKFLRGDQTWQVVAGGSGTDEIVHQTTAPVSPVVDDLWIDTDESAGVGLSSILAYAQVTASQGSIAAPTDLTGLSVTVTVPAGRRLRVTGRIGSQNTSSGVLDAVYIMAGATILQKALIATGGVSIEESLEASVVLSPVAGTHTFHLRADRSAGTMTMLATAQTPAYILVEDITGTLWPAGQSIGAGTIASEAWTDFTPVVTQSVALTLTPTYSRYSRVGRTVTMQGLLSFTSSGTAGQSVLLTLPIPAAGVTFRHIGIASFYNAGAQYHLMASLNNSSTIVRFQYTHLTNDSLLGRDAPFTVAVVSGNNMSFSFTYEAAS